MPYKNEAHLMGNYVNNLSSIYLVDELIRHFYTQAFKKGFDANLCKRLYSEINPSLINQSNEEVLDIRLKYDAPAFEIFQGLKRKHFGKDGKLLMLVNGVFEDNKGDKYSITIPSILNTDPYRINDQNYLKKPIDSYLTDTKTLEFIANYQYHLKRKHNFKFFTVKSSNFFYIPKNLENYFKNNGNLSFEKLIPFLYGTSNFIAITKENDLKQLSINKLKTPTLDNYLSNFFPFISSRHKINPVNKMMRKYNKRELLQEKDMISDWFAIREVNFDKSLVDKVQASILDSSNIIFEGNKYLINSILVKNYFEEPKESGFEAYVNSLIVQNKGIIFPIEFQGQTAPNFYRFEILKSLVDPASRENKDKQREKARSKGHLEFNSCVRGILEKIYGQPQTKFDIDTIKIINTTNK